MNIHFGRRLSDTHSMPQPNKYVQMLLDEYKDYAFDEHKAPSFKGNWRSEVFKKADQMPLDLEIGTGNGFFFAHRSSTAPDRMLVGLEIKFKPLIQSIRRALRNGATNARIARFHANLIDQLFESEELNNVFIHFPDPWPKKRSHKHRLIQDSFLEALFRLQRTGSYVEFKTDDRDYFEWSLERFQRSAYKITRLTNDLHSSEWSQENFLTHFEKLWTSKGIKINMLRAEKVSRSLII